MNAPAVQSVRSVRWAFWRFNWLANHKMLRALERAAGHAHGDLLDVGCGSMPFAGVFAGHVRRYVGVDIPTSHDFWGAKPHAYARGEALPFRDASVDTLLGVSLMNYLPDPLRLLREAARLVRPGGVILLEFPQMLPLDGEDPDYFRFTREGGEYLLRSAGFEPVECIPIGGLWARVGLSAIAALNRVNRGPTRVLTELPVRALYVLVQLGCELLDRVFHDPGEVLANLIVARRTP